MMKLTVLFATHNGGGVVGRTLEGYASQDFDPDAWEMIVVDNGSTDDTQAIVASFANILPLTLQSHPSPGKNRALNSAIPKISGDFVIVTDDDAVPNANFLASWARIAATVPQYNLFGGSIEPMFDVAPPDWMLKSRFHFAEIFAERHLGEGPMEAGAIFGPNMAVRKSVFDEGILFNEDIGPNGSQKNYPMGSETEFCTRTERAGHKAYFAAEPEVRHIVRKHQITTEFWVQRAFKHGLGFSKQMTIRSGANSYLHYMKARLKSQAFALASSLPLSDLRRNEMKWQASWLKGYSQT